MDEEKNNGRAQKPASALQKGAKKAKQRARRKLFRKIILAILPKLLMILIPVIIGYIIIAAMVDFIDKDYSEEFKTITENSLNFSSATKKNKINVNINNVTSGGAYQLTYKFNNEEGKTCTESEAIEMIKEQLVEENDKIRLSAFSDSELKIIGSLMANGLETADYSEEELKALAIFVKADIAGQSFDCRTDKDTIEIEDLQDNDLVYGIIELHKLTPTSSGYEEKELEFISYSEFKNLISSNNSEVLDKFSVDNDGYMVIAKASSTTIKYTYQYSGGGTMSEADIANLPEDYTGEDKNEYKIKEYPLKVNYKQYLKKYIASYGLLTDLLIATRNVDFCLELAEIALNSKIVLNVREETVQTSTHQVTKITQTNLYYDYISYEITGTSNQASNNIRQSQSNILIRNGHISETYENYSIDEDYSRKEISECFITLDTSSENYRYDIDIAEIDCWYLYYKRPYAEPEQKTSTFSKPSDYVGQFSETAEEVSGTSTGASNAAKNYLDSVKKTIKENNSNVNDFNGGITEIRTEKKSKYDTTVTEYKGGRITWKFGDETDLDTTHVQFKNITYINNALSFTKSGKKGFLYFYDKYIMDEIDLYVENDAEKKMFEMLDADSDTQIYTDIIKFLLYAYDGVDRGVTDLDKTFRVIDLNLRTGIGASAFGCSLSRDEFITAAEAYGQSVIASLAGNFYDICAKYDVNPCLAYGFAALESAWGGSSSEDHNLFQMGTGYGQEHGNWYDTYDDSIEDFCKWVVSAANPSSQLYSWSLSRGESYATVNSSFNGRPENNMYVLFCMYCTLPPVHDGDCRACIEHSCDFLGLANECNHADNDAPTVKEHSEYLQYQVGLRVKIAEDVFGKGCIKLNNSVVEGAYEVADHFMNSGVDVHYGGFYAGTNNINLPDYHNIEDCYNLPIEYPEHYGIVCTTFVNLAIWKAGLIDTETINEFHLHSPIGSASKMDLMEGWDIIDDPSDLQEGDVVWSEGSNGDGAHTWIYMDGDQMLDQSYCVINSDGSDTRGILKSASGSLQKFRRAWRYVGT